MSELTFTQDCLIGATNSLERWVCENNIPILVGLAYRGILVKFIVVGIAIVILLIIFINRKRLLKR